MWKLQYGVITAQFCENYFSDHSPMHIEILSDGAPTRKPFRFINVLADANEFMQTVDQQWNTTIMVPTCSNCEEAATLKGDTEKAKERIYRKFGEED